MDLKMIKKLLTLISESDVNEVAIEEGDFKIKVTKKAASDTNAQMAPYPVQYQLPQQPTQTAQQQPQPTNVDSSTAAAGQDTPAENKAKEEAEQPAGDTVKSPIVGTFYRSADPESDPFVEVGDTVTKGETLCIIEAMKIMNEIEAEFSGTINKILVDDGKPVEFEQPLFIIEKN